MSKRKILILLGMVIILLAWFGYRVKMSPLEVTLNNRIVKDGVFHPNKVLIQTEIGDEQFLIIFKNDYGNICTVVLEKSFFGYEVVDFNGEVSPYGGGSIPVGMHFGWYKKEAGWSGFGVVYDKNVYEIYIDGSKAFIESVDGIRLWYLVGKGELNELNMRLLDRDGNEIIY